MTSSDLSSLLVSGAKMFSESAPNMDSGDSALRFTVADGLNPQYSSGIRLNIDEINSIGRACSAGQCFGVLGGYYTFDSSFASKIGGYPLGAVLKYLDGNGALRKIRSTVQNNTTLPSDAVNGVQGSGDRHWEYVDTAVSFYAGSFDPILDDESSYDIPWDRTDSQSSSSYTIPYNCLSYIRIRLKMDMPNANTYKPVMHMDTILVVDGSQMMNWVLYPSYRYHSMGNEEWLNYGGYTDSLIPIYLKKGSVVSFTQIYYNSSGTPSTVAPSGSIKENFQRITCFPIV